MTRVTLGPKQVSIFNIMFYKISETCTVASVLNTVLDDDELPAVAIGTDVIVNCVSGLDVATMVGATQYTAKCTTTGWDTVLSCGEPLFCYNSLIFCCSLEFQTRPL